MKYLGFIPAFFALFVLSACGTTSKATVSDSADLSQYHYATITDVSEYVGSPVLMDLSSVRVYDALSETRLTVIGDREIEKLSAVQRQQLLVVSYVASQTDAESVITINFVEFSTGRPIASFRGAYGMGWGRKQDLERAVKNVIEQMKQHFSNR